MPYFNRNEAVKCFSLSTLLNAETTAFKVESVYAKNSFGSKNVCRVDGRLFAGNRD